jgi:hypothetical protein
MEVLVYLLIGKEMIMGIGRPTFFFGPSHVRTTELALYSASEGRAEGYLLFGCQPEAVWQV